MRPVPAPTTRSTLSLLCTCTLYMWGKNGICFEPDRFVGGSAAREIQIMKMGTILIFLSFWHYYCIFSFLCNFNAFFSKEILSSLNFTYYLDIFGAKIQIFETGNIMKSRRFSPSVEPYGIKSPFFSGLYQSLEWQNFGI